MGHFKTRPCHLSPPASVCHAPPPRPPAQLLLQAQLRARPDSPLRGDPPLRCELRTLTLSSTHPPLASSPPPAHLLPVASSWPLHPLLTFRSCLFSPQMTLTQFSLFLFHTFFSPQRLCRTGNLHSVYRTSKPNLPDWSEDFFFTFVISLWIDFYTLEVLVIF